MVKLVKKYSLYILFLSLGFTGACKKGNDNTINLFTVEDDMQIGAQLEQEIANNPTEYPVLDPAKYPAAYGHLNRMFNAILNNADSLNYGSTFDWSIKIIHNDEVLNAFAGPGGKTYVFTGLIKYLDSEDQLAGVLGHEIAHADRRHVTDQMTRDYGLQVMLDILVGKNQGALSQIAVGLADLKFSRSAEREADEYSVIYLYPTEYDARGASRFFEKLIETGQTGGTPEFLSTHPNPDNRVEDIQNKWKQKGSKVGGTFEARYAEFKSSLP